jgi:hypothetical protein
MVRSETDLAAFDAHVAAGRLEAAVGPRECLAQIPRGEVGSGDDAVQDAEAIVERLQPACLDDGIRGPRHRLHVDHALDVLEARLGDEVISRITPESSSRPRPRSDPSS